VTEKKEVLEARTDVAGQAFKPGEVGALERLAGLVTVDQEKAASGLATLIEGNGHQRADLEFVLGGAGEAGDVLKRTAVAAVPAKAGAWALEMVPADGGVHIVKKEAVGAGERKILGDKALAFAMFEAPHENTLEVGVAIDEQSLFGAEDDGEIVEEQAQRFGEALVDLHGGSDAGEKIAFRGEETGAVAEKGEAGASGKGTAGDADPGKHAHPMDFAADGGESYEKKREDARDGQSGVKSPASAGYVTNEEIRKPRGDREGADVHESGEGEDVANERQVPRAASKNLLRFDHEDGKDQPGDEEGNGAADFVGRRKLEKSEDGKENDNRTGIGDLPLEMVTIGRILAHARAGIFSLVISLTRRGLERWEMECSGSQAAMEEAWAEGRGGRSGGIFRQRWRRDKLNLQRWE